MAQPEDSLINSLLLSPTFRWSDEPEEAAFRIGASNLGHGHGHGHGHHLNGGGGGGGGGSSGGNGHHRVRFSNSTENIRDNERERERDTVGSSLRVKLLKIQM